MREECIEALIETNREIEFEYKNELYSITYFKGENGEKIVSFCKFYCTPTNFDKPYAVIKHKIGGKTIQEIFAELPDDAFAIF